MAHIGARATATRRATCSSAHRCSYRRTRASRSTSSRSWARSCEAAAKSGYPLRVAVIASPADLGSVTPLWRQPQAYAGFLGEELSLLYKGTLLVVMPDGFGLYGPGAAVPAQRAAALREADGWARCEHDRGRAAAVGGRRTPTVGRPDRDAFGPEHDRLRRADRARDRRRTDRGRMDREPAHPAAPFPASAGGVELRRGRG